MGSAGGVKYADFAVGELIKNASTRPWFDDTIFVFIADHCTRSGGKNEISVENYHIPCIFYGPKIIQPGTVEELTSQIDIAPTLFDLLNWQYTSSFVGRSVFNNTARRQPRLCQQSSYPGLFKGRYAGDPGARQQGQSYKVDPVSHAEQEIAPQNDYD